MNIACYVSETAHASPNREALRYEGVSYSYAELDSLSARVAAGLRQSGVERGTRVAIFLPNLPEFIFSYLGAARLGALAVSLNPQLKREEVRNILLDSSASVIVTDPERRQQVPDDVASLKKVILCGDGDGSEHMFSTWLVTSTSSVIDPIAVDASDELALLYTSGTTGTPKGVTLTHGNVCFTAEQIAHCCATTAQDRLLLMVPLSHCYGQNVVLNQGFKASATHILVNGFDPHQLLALIERERITMLFGVPAMYSALLNACEDPKQLRSVRYCMSGATPLPEQIAVAWFERFGAHIYQGYGLTESSPSASHNHFPERWPNSIGRPIDGVEMRIADEHGSESGVNELGEILIRGPNVMKGYWNKPQETRATIQNGWLHSGDLGRRDADGNFYVMDRIKDMINVSGLKVYPTEVESILNQHASIREAAVFGIPHPMAGERVAAIVVLHDGCESTPQDIIAFCRGCLASYKVPEQIQFAASLPRNATGKLLRRVLATGMHLNRQRNIAVSGYYFKSVVSGEQPWFIAQHQMFGVPTLPITAMVEWALATVQSITASKTMSRLLEGLVFTRAMVFPDDQSRIVQAVVESDGRVDDGIYRIRFLSQMAERPDAEWIEHGSIISRPSDAATPIISIVPEALTKHWQEQSPDLYEWCRAAGLNYGPALRGLKQLWLNGNQALGRIDIAESIRDENAYTLHPVVLDACLHTVMAFFDREAMDADTLTLPVAINRLHVRSRLPNRVWCHVTWKGRQADSNYLADIDLITDTGASVATIQGLHLAKVGKASILAAVSSTAVAAVSVPSISVAELALLSEQDATRCILQGLRKMLGDVLRIDMSRGFGDDSHLADMSFSSLGVDSLMAMELRNRVIAWLGIQVPANLFIGRNRIAQTVGDIYERMLVGSLSQRNVDGDQALSPEADIEVMVL